MPGTHSDYIKTGPTTNQFQFRVKLYLLNAILFRFIEHGIKTDLLRYKLGFIRDMTLKEMLNCIEMFLYTM